jgi:acyl dehydratase
MSGPRLQIGDSLESLVLHAIGEDRVERYAAASGDENPIHLSKAAAEAAGLPGPIVHGMFIMGQFERLLRAWRPDGRIESLSTRFLQPLAVGEFLEVGARVVSLPSENSCRLRLSARNSAGQVVAMGEAAVTLER